MADEEFAGSALHATWTTTASTVTISTEFRNFQFTDSGEDIDATAGADIYRRTLDSFQTCQVTASWLMQSTQGSAEVTNLRKGTEGTLVWGEAGSAAAGTPIKRTLPAKVSTSSWTTPYNDVVSIDCTWIQNGALTIEDYGA